jgi:hypothetical protein
VRSDPRVDIAWCDVFRDLIAAARDEVVADNVPNVRCGLVRSQAYGIRTGMGL